MYISESKIRVRYGETDKMGVVYYGNYALYYEVGRTELFRELGLSYKHFEQQGIILPVVSLNIKYIAPAYYDDVLTIKTTLTELPGYKINFTYEIFNKENKCLNQGETSLVFIDEKKGRPIKAPTELIDKLNGYLT